MGARSARQRAARAATSRKTVTSISPTAARSALRRTSTAAPTLTDRRRIAIAVTLIAIPMIARSRKPRSNLTRASSRSPRGQLLRRTESESMEEVARHDTERREPVHDAAPEPDGARLLEIPGGHRDLADPIAHPSRHDLRDELLVEDEVVTVGVVRDRLEEPPAVSTQPGVVLG